MDFKIIETKDNDGLDQDSVVEVDSSSRTWDVLKLDLPGFLY